VIVHYLAQAFPTLQIDAVGDTHVLWQILDRIGVATVVTGYTLGWRKLEVTAMNGTEHMWRQREVETLSALSNSLRSAQEPAEVMDAAVRCARILLGAKASAMVAEDRSTGRVRIERMEGVWDISPEVLLSHVGDAIHERAVSIQTLSYHERPSARADAHGLVCAPILIDEEATGALLASGFEHPTGDEAPLLGIVADMTANALHRAYLRQQTRAIFQRLENRERFIDRVQESIPSSLIVLDRSLRVVSVNRNFLEKSRRTSEDILGRRLGDIFTKALLDYTKLDEKARAVFQTGRGIDGGKVAYRAPGVPTRIYYYRLVPIKADHAIENVMLFMDDITEREQLGQEVRQAERHLASVVECADDMVISLDIQGGILTWNRAAERLVGLTSDQARGRPLSALCSVEQSTTIRDMLRTVASGSQVHNTEFDLTVVSGDKVPVALSCSPMRDDEGRVVGIVGVGRDLTERRHLQTQLIHSAKMASLGVMAGGIAHELRNPLGIILAATQLIEECFPDPQMVEECIAKVKTASQRASLVIESLLKFARPQTQRMEDVSVDQLLDDALTLTHNQITLHKIDLIRDLSAHGPTVWGNPALLQQVFTNLILNACNAMPHGGTLTLRTLLSDSESVEICIEDTGCGISAENLSKIFDPFYTTMPVGKGTGLGLAISYSIIQQHGGTIDAASQTEQGTRFKIMLPQRRPVGS
jgi:PAS domain S-box-containing protein